jgi:hypothetical protein
MPPIGVPGVRRVGCSELWFRLSNRGEERLIEERSHLDGVKGDNETHDITESQELLRSSPVSGERINALEHVEAVRYKGQGSYCIAYISSVRSHGGNCKMR